MSMMASPNRRFWTAMTFLAPNILGVLIFVVFPVVFSLVMAFTNWDLRRHNMFKDESLSFVGLRNFADLLADGGFRRYLGNTLYLMIVIPFSIAGSLIAAILLSKDTRGTRRTFLWLIAGSVFVISTVGLVVMGLGGSAMAILLCGVAAAILLGGVFGGVTVYRTLFYLPHFTAGVATFILWRRMYNPETGPINSAVRPVVGTLEAIIATVPTWMIYSVYALGLLMVFAGTVYGLHRLRRLWDDGEVGTRSVIMGSVPMLLPAITAMFWQYTQSLWWLFAAMIAVAVLSQLGIAVVRRRMFTCPAGEGSGSALMIGVLLMTGLFTLLGLTVVVGNLPAMVQAPDAPGLDTPSWIYDYHWAKPSLMIVMLWAAIGSNNMLLYLAALTNVPQELYEAADIDGAKPLQRFWNVTWPQLAPTTFFIAVMSTIGGLQGGFEMARTMTEGGPAGSTTTLAYFIYIEGFETGRLGVAAAASWMLFMLVFAVTMFNWKFGNQYVNE
ncbi:MAG: ABC transporter permease subunit [Phycisphaeraceae bacterium]